MRYNAITYPDVSNGLGCRVVLWIQGCRHHCKGCHNPETWDFKGGNEFTDEVKEKLIKTINLPYIKGLTLSGGDPLDSYDDVVKLLAEVRERCTGKDVWLFTGYTMEEIDTTDMRIVLPFVDYVVDGVYDETQRDVTLAFRGSRNQRIWQKVDDKFVEARNFQ